MALFLSPSVPSAFYHLVVPRYLYELRPVIDFVQRNREPDDEFIIMGDPVTAELYMGRTFPKHPQTPGLLPESGSSR